MSGTSDPSPQISPAAGLSESESYRPLSLLALIGFAASLVYALLIGVGGLVALFQRSPWLLPAWLFVAPLCALAISAWARARIQDSEGTLSGLSLTRWGIALSLVFGMLYGAYYAATYYAIRHQTSILAESFLESIKKGELDQAFTYSLIPPRPAVDSDLRSKLELDYNTPVRGGSGPLGSFKGSDWVHYLMNCGEQAQIRLGGIRDWSYDRAGYKVTLEYHVDTPVSQFDLVISTLGQENRSSKTRGRLWHINLGETGLSPMSEQLTSEGTELLGLGTAAHSFASTWAGEWGQRQWSKLYQGTLDQAQREHFQRAGAVAHLADAAALTGPAPFAFQDASYQELFRNLDAFAGGTLVEVDEKGFWTPPDKREEILRRVKDTFNPVKAKSPQIRLANTRVPIWRRESGELVFGFGCILVLPNAAEQKAEYILEAQLFVRAPESQIGSARSPWRVSTLKLISAHSAPEEAGPRPPK